MKTIIRFASITAISAAALLAPAANSLAQDYPNKKITIVVPFAAGGGVDIVARLLGEELRTKLGQPVVVENKPGASGMIGAMAVVKAPADGYTLLLGSSGETAINPFVFKEKMQYAPQKDLAPITLVTRIPNVLVASLKLPVNSIEQLIEYAKKNPGKLSYATSGIGNVQHLNGELLEEMAGIKMINVPYKGAAAQLADLVAGNVDITFVSYAAASAFISGDRVKAIGVTSAKPAKFAPNIPPLASYKPLSQYVLENWFGLFVPAGTPVAIQQKINEAVTTALRDPALVAKLAEQGGEASPMTIDEFRKFVTDESKKFAQIVERANITLK